jgi:hypothetical protein
MCKVEKCRSARIFMVEKVLHEECCVIVDPASGDFLDELRQLWMVDPWK